MHPKSELHSDYIKQLLGQISQVHEQQDQSREEQCIPSIEEFQNLSEIDPSREIQNRSIVGVKGPIKKCFLGDICRKQAESKWETKREDQLIKQLKQRNQKLFEDNKKLLLQCIRLTKIVKSGISENCLQGHTGTQLGLLETKLIEQENEITTLKKDNSQLKMQISSLKESSWSTQKQTSESVDAKQLKEENERLSKRIEEYERKEFTAKFSGVNSTMLSSSKCSEWERDRVISNIKIVYENQIKNLQEEIRDRKDEICRLNRAVSGSKRTNQSPPVRRPGPLSYHH